jgi:protein tyrosine phosphatase
MKSSNPFPSLVKAVNLTQDLSIKYVVGDPKMAVLAIPITLKDIPSRNQHAEFQTLTQITNTNLHFGALERNKALAYLNRYSDVLPYSHNLVRPFPDGSHSPNYINGNVIHSPNVFGNLSEFVATQGPLPNTAQDFWTLVAALKIEYIVGVIEPESLPNRCSQYWPTKAPLQFGNWAVEVASDENDAFLCRKTLNLVNQATGNKHKITHLHLHSWKDYQAFDEDQYASFLELLEEVWQYRHSGPKPPVIVHCSAGIGRTGTFMASYYLYEEFKRFKAEKKEFSFSIFGTVRHLREQRHGAVQSFKQYQFLYDIVRHFK